MIAICTLITASYSYCQQTVDELRAIAEQKIEEGDLSYASMVYENAIDLDSLNYDLYLEHASVLRDQGNHEAALVQLSFLVENDTLLGPAHNAAGLIFLDIRKYGYAYRAYTDAIKFAPSGKARGYYYNNRSGVHLKTQDWEAALADIDSAALYLPESVLTVNNRAVIYLRLGEGGKAVSALKSLIELDTMKAFAYNNLALTYTRMDSVETALLYYDSAYTYLDTINIGAASGLYYSNYADALRRANRFKEALTSINKSIALYPGNSYAYRTMGMIYLGLNMPSESCDALSYSQKLDFKMQYGDEVDQLIKEHCD